MSFKRFIHDINHSTFIAEDLEVKFVSSNKTDRTITISINGKIYEYEFKDGPLWDIEQRFKGMLKYSSGRALQWIKSQADDFTKLSEATYRVWYTNPDNGERYIDVEAKDKDDAREKFRKHHPMAANGMYKLFQIELREDAGAVAANNVGGGHVAGIAPGEDPPVGKKAQKRFAGAAVFEVDHDKMWKSRFGKHPRHRYAKYVGEDGLGQEIRSFAKKNPHESIILKNSKTGEMLFLRRRPAKSLKEMTVGLSPNFFPRVATELTHLTGATKADGKLVKTTDDEADLAFQLTSPKAVFKLEINVPNDINDTPTIKISGGKKPTLSIKADVFFSDPRGCAEDIVDAILDKDEGYFDEL